MVLPRFYSYGLEFDVAHSEVAFDHSNCPAGFATDIIYTVSLKNDIAVKW